MGIHFLSSHHVDALAHISRCFCILRTRSFAPQPLGHSSVRNSQVFECAVIAFLGSRRKQWVHWTVSFLAPTSNVSVVCCGGGGGGVLDKLS